MIILFSFSYDTETGQAAIAGTVGIDQALSVLQQLAITQAVNEAKEEFKKEKESDKEERDHAGE